MYNYQMDDGDTETRVRLATQFDGHGQVYGTTGTAILRILVPGCSALPGTLRHFTRRVAGSWLLTGDEAHAFLRYIKPYVKRKSGCIRSALYEWDRVQKATEDYVKLRVESQKRIGCNCS